MAAAKETLFPERQIVAQTILEQLGGRRFLAMTGAKYLTSFMKEPGCYGLQMTLPKGFAKNGISMVRIWLSTADLYEFEGFSVKGVNYQPIALAPSGIYADQLQRAFTEFTGLDTRL